MYVYTPTDYLLLPTTVYYLVLFTSTDYNLLLTITPYYLLLPHTVYTYYHLLSSIDYLVLLPTSCHLPHTLLPTTRCYILSAAYYLLLASCMPPTFGNLPPGTYHGLCIPTTTYPPIYLPTCLSAGLLLTY